MDINNKLITLFFLFFFATSSSALVKPIGFTNTLKTTAIGANTVVKFSSGSNFFNKAVSIGSASIGAVIKKRAFSPWGAALLVAITAAGIIYENDDYIYPSIHGNELGVCSANGAINNLSSCMALAPNASFREYYVGDWLTSNNAYCIVEDGFPSHYCSLFWTPQNGFIGDPETLVLEPTPVTDSEIADIVYPDIAENDLTDLLTDPDTGLPDSAITEIAQAAIDLDVEIALLSDSDPNNDPTELTNQETPYEALLQTLIKTNNELIDAISAETADSDPCLENPDSLGCSDLGEEILPEDILTLDVPFSFTPVSLTSSGTCPAPKILALSFGNIELDTSMICTFATLLNPVIIALCTFIGLYILNGGIKNG